MGGCDALLRATTAQPRRRTRVLAAGVALRQGGLQRVAPARQRRGEGGHELGIGGGTRERALAVAAHHRRQQARLRQRQRDAAGAGARLRLL